MIKNIVFDFGGVIVDWNPEYLFKDVFSDRSELDHFLENICTPDWNEKQDAGRSLTEAIRTLQERHPKYRDEIRLYYDEWTTMLGGPIEQNVALLKPLKMNYRIFGLTNWSAETFPIACDLYPFFGEFEGIVVSGKERLAKPDERIYLLLLERYGLSAADCLFIDDNARNIRAAKALGFHTLHLGSDGNLEEELIQRGIRVQGG
ncbi:MAG: HAD family phosphatase [Xanthomonadales bacterium]|nr:HAD family phosphatase [Xanthomonadales bacterium]